MTWCNCKGISSGLELCIRNFLQIRCDVADAPKRRSKIFLTRRVKLICRAENAISIAIGSFPTSKLSSDLMNFANRKTSHRDPWASNTPSWTSFPSSSTVHFWKRPCSFHANYNSGRAERTPSVLQSAVGVSKIDGRHL